MPDSMVTFQPAHDFNRNILPGWVHPAAPVGRANGGVNPALLPGNGLSAILKVNGVKLQLIGDRIVNGVVELGSFVGL